MPRLIARTDLMTALQQSIGAEAKQSPPKPKAAAPKGKPAAKRNPNQREILLPIADGAPTSKPLRNRCKSPAWKKASLGLRADEVGGGVRRNWMILADDKEEGNRCDHRRSCVKNVNMAPADLLPLIRNF